MFCSGPFFVFCHYLVEKQMCKLVQGKQKNEKVKTKGRSCRGKTQKLFILELLLYLFPACHRTHRVGRAMSLFTYAVRTRPQWRSTQTASHWPGSHCRDTEHVQKIILKENRKQEACCCKERQLLFCICSNVTGVTGLIVNMCHWKKNNNNSLNNMLSTCECLKRNLFSVFLPLRAESLRFLTGVTGLALWACGMKLDIFIFRHPHVYLFF